MYALQDALGLVGIYVRRIFVLELGTPLRFVPGCNGARLRGRAGHGCCFLGSGFVSRRRLIVVDCPRGLEGC